LVKLISMSLKVK